MPKRQQGYFRELEQALLAAIASKDPQQIELAWQFFINEYTQHTNAELKITEEDAIAQNDTSVALENLESKLNTVDINVADEDERCLLAYLVGYAENISTDELTSTTKKIMWLLNQPQIAINKADKNGATAVHVV